MRILRLGIGGFLISIGCLLQAQKYDYHWILGYPDFGNTDIIFTDNSTDTLHTNRNVDMANSQTTICNAAGALQFFTNGARIYTAANDTMDNGDSLNYGYYWNYWDGISYNTIQELVALPNERNGIWNLIHYFIDYTSTPIAGLYVRGICQSQIDMKIGAGQVVFKNRFLLQDTLATYVAACKHGNGRDWWVISGRWGTNYFIRLLVSSDTIVNLEPQHIGEVYPVEGAGQAVFSPDGSKFAWTDGDGGVNIYSFDRCNGMLSDPINLPLHSSSGNNQFGLAFSPNSEFLYATQSHYVLQFNATAPDIWDSRDTVGVYQLPPDSTSLPGTYFLMQLAPNGKIYISANNGIKWLHVINNPDFPGGNCDFVNYGFSLTAYNNFGLPSYPHYRLGNAVGSPCDTLSGLGDDLHASYERTIKVFPNPATDIVNVDYGFTDWNKGEVSLVVTDAFGRILYNQKLPMYSGFQQVSTSQFSYGLYYVFIKRAGEVIASDTFIKN